MYDGYIICATPRSGSTLLCDLLASTGSTGEPDSYYGRKFVDWWASQWGLADRKTMTKQAFNEAYLAAAIKAGKAGTSIFGLRLMQENLAELCVVLDQLFRGLVSDEARLEAAFGRVLFVHLFRADKLAQAVSLVKAKQTGLWHVAPDGTEVERLAPPADPKYDFQQIRSELVRLESHDKCWVKWFEQQGIEALRVEYETLSAEPAATLAGICKALGVAGASCKQVSPGVAKLADDISAEWISRYRKDAGKPGA